MTPIRATILAVVGAFIALFLAAVTMLLHDPSPSMKAVAEDGASYSRQADGTWILDTKLCLDKNDEARLVEAEVQGPSPEVVSMTDPTGLYARDIPITQACVKQLGGPRDSSEYYGPGGTPVRVAFRGAAPEGYDRTVVRYTYQVPETSALQHVDVEYPPVGR